MTDPLGDMLTRIRNGVARRKSSVSTPASKLRARVLDVLQAEGYIRGYTEGWRLTNGKAETEHRAQVPRRRTGDPRDPPSGFRQAQRPACLRLRG